MSPEQAMLSRKQLAKKLVDKHKALMAKNGREYELLHRLFVLEEKQDLLVHWIRDAEQAESGQKAKEYVKQKKANDDEIAAINAELSSSFPLAAQGLRQRHDSLKRHVDSHKAAINHWDELSK